MPGNSPPHAVPQDCARHAPAGERCPRAARSQGRGRQGAQRRNALKHGVCGRPVLFENEDAAGLAAFKAALCAQLTPDAAHRVEGAP